MNPTELAKLADALNVEPQAVEAIQKRVEAARSLGVSVAELGQLEARALADRVMTDREKEVCRVAGMTPERYISLRDPKHTPDEIRAEQAGYLRQAARRAFTTEDRDQILRHAEELEKAPLEE